MKISAWSMASLTKACVPMLSDRSSVVGLTFDATLAWPMYDWMGLRRLLWSR